MINANTQEYLLGLDIGSNSVGWAVIRMREGKGKPIPYGVIDIGARVFEEGVTGSLDSGHEESRNVQRREARQQRKQTDRRSRRKTRVFNCLQRAGLLPEPEDDSPDARHNLILKIDHDIRAEIDKTREEDKEHGPANEQVLPYWLRAEALDRKLTKLELGRALYHLAQRRGYKSNRLAPEKKDEDKGVVKEGISSLRNEIQDSGARTLGEYFSQLDPQNVRIRTRYTSRAMYLEEFDAIWNAQKSHNPEILTDEFRDELHKAMFYQRPLKSQKHLIGCCQFEDGCKRAPMAILAYQRFRMVQMLNNTMILEPGYTQRDLTDEQWNSLADLLEREGDITFPRAKKKDVLGLAKGEKLNWQEGEEKKFIGNRTSAKLYKVFGDTWFEFDEEDKERIVDDLRSFENADALARRGMKAWGLDEEKAQEFAGIKLEEGYANLSRRAIEKLLPHMEEGIPYATAVKEVYGDYDPVPKMDFLPPALDAIGDLRNPAVTRALSELRTVVNALIKKHGKPSIIKIEMARDLKRGKKERQRLTRDNRKREKEREDASKRIRDECGIENPKRSDIEKVLLADECGWECPYTGERISMKTLIGDHPQFDVEHIIPYSRSLDNSFINKTLCDAEENRNVKKKRTPYEAYGGNDEKWNIILGRIQKFRGDYRTIQRKMERFQWTDEDIERNLSEFTSRQLNDTRYASKLAAQYLGILYGGRDDETSTRRIRVCGGQLTAMIRNEFDLNAILGDGGQKSRDDHRHHAVDALAIALTDEGMIQKFSRAAARKEEVGKWEPLEKVWGGFLEDATNAIDGIIVSHRFSNRVRGQLHEETLYGTGGEGNEETGYAFVRKPLASLTSKMVGEIVDPVVRQRVKDRMDELDEKDPSKAFAERENHPYIERNGRRIYIHKVRIKKNLKLTSIGKGSRRRHVKTGSNHHIEVFEVKDKKGNLKWEGRMVDIAEALRRKKAGENICNRCYPDGSFICSLAGGDIFEIDTDESVRKLFRIRTLSMTQKGYITIEYVNIADSRLKKEIRESKEWYSSPMDSIRKLHFQKVTVTPLGEVRRAND